ncbi:hypothetical protein OF376_03045, partial [Ureaplasma miroungigenitalium]
MKKINKKILGFSLLGFGAVAALGGVAAITASCGNPDSKDKIETRSKIIDQILARKGEQKKYGELNNVDAFYWARFWNSPFEQIRNLAKGLDEAIDLNKSSTFKPLIDKGLYEKTFLAEAEKQIAN